MSQKKLGRISCTGLDRLAVDHAGMVLHAYQQIAQGAAIDLAAVCERSFFVRKYIYQPKPQALISGWVFYPIYGKTGIKTYGERSMVGMLGVHRRKKKMVFSFRNTQHFKDLGPSMGISFTKEHGLSYPGYLHDAYVQFFKTCLPSIEKVLDKLLEQEKEDWDNYQLVMTGHSLGGVLATLMAIYLAGSNRYNHFWQRNQLAVITFGSPYVIARYKQKDFVHTWIHKHIGYVKCFERSTDPAPAITKIARFRLVGGKKSWEAAKQLVPVPIAKPVLLPHYNYSSFNFIGAHDFRKYRKAIYMALKSKKRWKKLKYSPFYTSSWIGR